MQQSLRVIVEDDGRHEEEEFNKYASEETRGQYLQRQIVRR